MASSSRDRVAWGHAIAVALVQRLGRVGRDVEADLVEKRERSHRHAELQEQPVDAQGTDALDEQPHGLVEVGPEQAVDEEAGHVLGHDRRLAELDRQRGRPRDRLVGRLLAAHDLHQRHRLDRVEEVHADDPLGVRQRRLHLGDAERGGVGRQDRVVHHGRRELAEDLALDAHDLGHGLDRDLRAPDAGDPDGNGQRVDRGVRPARRQAPALQLLRDVCTVGDRRAVEGGLTEVRRGAPRGPFRP